VLVDEPALGEFTRPIATRSPGITVLTGVGVPTLPGCLGTSVRFGGGGTYG
jgi:hypothetical protein